MQDLVNVRLIVRPVSISLWQYPESWKVELSLYEQLLDKACFPVFPQAKVDTVSSGLLAKTCLLQASLLSLSGSVKSVNIEHRGYCFSRCCNIILQLLQSVFNWGAMLLGGICAECAETDSCLFRVIGKTVHAVCLLFLLSAGCSTSSIRKRERGMLKSIIYFV